MMTTSLQRGYTLLEMIVSVAVFSIIMLAATGTFLTLISLDRQSRATTDVVTNLSFAVDSMTRQIRTGTNYRCNGSSASPNCANGSSGSSYHAFTFTDSDSRTIGYRLDDGQVIADVTTGASTLSLPLTDPRIEITDLTFYVRGSGTGDGVQPNVTISIRGTMDPGVDEPIDFAIQGSATQRFIDL